MKIRFIIIVVIIVAVGALIGGIMDVFSIGKQTAGVATPQKVVSDYGEALDVVSKNYGGVVKGEDLSDSAMQGMLWTLDPHSSFFTQEQLKKLDEEQASQFYGIGVSILQHRDGVYVQSVVQGTPAERSGLRYGDRIVSVDGKDATEWSSSEVSKNVRGERNTSVNVKVERAGVAEPVSYDIIRAGVPLPSIRNYFLMKDDVGYVGLTGGFQQTTGDELSSAIDQLRKAGMKSLVLDLRGNPGGLLDQAVDVSSKFIPRGNTVVSVRSPRSGSARDLKAVGGDQEKFPLIVMINSGSASASEIVAGAIQDYDRGLVVGTGSFGKGLVQRIFRLPYSTGLTLTTARYYTPFGRSLQRDYSGGSIYDYYTHGEDSPLKDQENAQPKPVGSPVTTAFGRTLYGGRGIEPDIVVEQPTLGVAKSRINEAAFFYVRSLVAGKIPGLESYKHDKQTFQPILRANDAVISDRLIESFFQFTAADAKSGLTSENLRREIDWVKVRLRQELATADLSSEAGLQVLIENDAQILKAIDSMSEAAKLAAQGLDSASIG